jgi:molybdenum cofactor cytidylyltransferase
VVKRAPRRSQAHAFSLSEASSAKARVGAVIAAAGRSSRMGKINKLLAPLSGKPMLLHAVDAVMESGLRDIFVVTGYESETIRELLATYPVEFVHNEAFAGGMSTSLRAGIDALDESFDAAVICLGDMPRVRAEHIRLLVDHFDASAAAPICVPVHRNALGNPVLWPRRFFSAIRDLRGDDGARILLERHPDEVTRVEIADDGVMIDVDSEEALIVLERRHGPNESF